MKQKLLYKIVWLVAVVLWVLFCSPINVLADNTWNISISISSLWLVIGTPASVSLTVSQGNIAQYAFSEPFWIKDLRGRSTWHYTTIQLNWLYQSWWNWVITWITLSDTSWAVLSWWRGNWTQINPAMTGSNWVDITNPVLYFYRANNSNNGWVVNKYISTPTLHINTIWAPAWTYRWNIVFTLYDMGYPY